MKEKHFQLLNLSAAEPQTGVKMKRERSISKIIKQRFIGYSIGIAAALMVFDLVMDIVVDILGELGILSMGMSFPALKFTPDFFKSLLIMGLTYSVIRNIVTVLIYAAAMILFSRGLIRDIVLPIRHMVKGFRQVTAGDLQVSLDFETETEFREMQDAFNFMVRRLQDSEQQRLAMEEERMQMLSHIAHDLKTPMTTVSGYAEALSRGIVEGADRQKEYYEAIKYKADQVNHLVDQLLMFSKLGTPGYRPDFQNTDLAELLRVNSAALFGEAEERQMKLEMQLPDKPVWLSADEAALNRAAANLLTNAIRHNPPGSLLLVELREAAHWLEIRIADNGAVIPPALAERLFEPFVCGDEARSGSSGTGLGLAIVRKVVAEHSGRVRLAEADPPYSKCFVIYLPVRQS